jgi:hypothetical protein
MLGNMLPEKRHAEEPVHDVYENFRPNHYGNGSIRCALNIQKEDKADKL